MHTRLVEDVGFKEKADLAGPLVQAVVELPDPAGYLADLPSADASCNDLSPVALLELPERCLGLECLPAVKEVERAAGAGQEVTDECEHPVGVLQKEAEFDEDLGVAAPVAIDGHSQGAVLLSTTGRTRR